MSRYSSDHDRRDTNLRSPIPTVDFGSKTLVRPTYESFAQIKYSVSPIEPISDRKESEVATVEREEPVMPQSDILVSEPMSQIQSTSSGHNHRLRSDEKGRMKFMKMPAQPDKCSFDKNVFRSEVCITSPFSKAWDQAYLKSNILNVRTESNEKSITTSEKPTSQSKQSLNSQFLKARKGTPGQAGGSFSKEHIFHTSTPNIYQKTFKAMKKENNHLLKTLFRPAQNVLNGKKFSHESIKMNCKMKKKTDSSMSFNRDESSNQFLAKPKTEAGSVQSSHTTALIKHRTVWAERHEEYMSHLRSRNGKSEDKETLNRLRSRELQI